MTDPELSVLDVLVATCQQTRRLNPSADVARAALTWETRFVAARSKREAALSEVAAFAAAVPATNPTEGRGGDAALAA